MIAGNRGGARRIGLPHQRPLAAPHAEDFVGRRPPAQIPVRHARAGTPARRAWRSRLVRGLRERDRRWCRRRPVVPGNCKQHTPIGGARNHQARSRLAEILRGSTRWLPWLTVKILLEPGESIWRRLVGKDAGSIDHRLCGAIETLAGFADLPLSTPDTVPLLLSRPVTRA